MTAPGRADIDHWNDVAAEWIAWARAPGHDPFWAYCAALRDFIGPGDGNALDVGCGEGRVSRELGTLGYRVAAADPVAALIAAAEAAESAATYAVAPADRLPFETASFDLVVAYNVLMDVDDVGACLREMRRVSRPGGRLVLSIVHPFVDRGRFDGDTVDSPFVVTGSYFDDLRFEGEETRDGLRMRFAGWSRPLETYAAALASAGFVIDDLREPQPDPTVTHLTRWRRLPLFLWISARVAPLSAASPDACAG